MHSCAGNSPPREGFFRGGLTFSDGVAGGRKWTLFFLASRRNFNQMKFSIAAALFVSVVALPCVGAAQVDDQFAWGLTAGAAFPMNQLKKDHNTGVNAGITFAFGGVGQLFGVRIDGMFNQFGGKSGTTGGDARILGATINLVYSVFGDFDRIYVTGGVGGYGIRPDVPGQDSKNDFGTNGGIGLWLPSVNGFIEARYHHFFRALPDKRPATFVPITLGVLF